MTATAALASPDAPMDGAPARSSDRVGSAKRGPNTPEGKARSAMNAVRHGLRARAFGILPEEDKTAWAEHIRDLRAGYGPVDAAEEKLVTAIAVAMWNEIRADRILVETMAEIPPCRPGRSHGTNLQQPRHARSLNTALRYLTAASMATQRAQRAFFQHRKAKCQGLLVPAPPELAEPPANQNYTNENPREPDRPLALPAPAEPDPRNCTNELPAPRQPQPAPGPLAALRARLDRLLAGPGPKDPAEWDLIAAIRALKLPGAAPYRGKIDPGQLDRLLAEHRFDDAGLAWLAGLRPVHAGPERMAVAAPRRVATLCR